MMKLAAAALCALALSGCATGGRPSILNSNDATGGDCADGDQLCTECHGYGASWTCPANTACGTGVRECVELNPAPTPFSPAFAGAALPAAKRESDAGAP